MALVMATPKLQLQRQAVSHKAILDFTVQRMPQLPETVLRRFPELRSAGDELERLRINLQLQLREQFVAIREMLDQVATAQKLETAKVEIADEIKKIENKITNISNVVNVFGSTGKATTDISGTVKTDKTVDDPVVYLKITIDELLAALETGTNVSITEINNEINNLTSFVFGLNITVESLVASVAELITWQTPQRGSGFPDPVATPGRFDGDTYWDIDTGPPGSYRWDSSIANWYSMA